MSVYQRWLRICTDCAYIGAALLAVWAIPLLHQVGLLALLPAAGLIAAGWCAVTTAGCALLWFRHEWSTSRARLWLASLGRVRPAWAQREV